MPLAEIAPFLRKWFSRLNHERIGDPKFSPGVEVHAIPQFAPLGILAVVRAAITRPEFKAVYAPAARSPNAPLLMDTVGLASYTIYDLNLVEDGIPTVIFVFLQRSPVHA
jgi:hypothetical protein